MGAGDGAKMDGAAEGEQKTKGKGVKMDERRENEIARRKKARAHAGEVVAGSGERGKPRRMPRMVSARLDAELFAQLRLVAQRRKTTVSELLREGAELVLEDAHADAKLHTSFTVSGAQEWVPRTTERELAAH